MNFIYTTKHVNTPEEYINALMAGYDTVEISARQDEALFALLRERKDERDVLLCEYARLLLNGYGCEQDPDTAFSIWLSLAESGLEPAQNCLGYCYEFGHGTLQDCKKAVEWYTKAAESGYLPATETLAECYKNGRCVPQDDKKAAEWYAKATAQIEAETDRTVSRVAGSMQNTFDMFQTMEDSRCPFCGSYMAATEKKGLFGVKTVCRNCGKRLPKKK